MEIQDFGSVLFDRFSIGIGTGEFLTKLRSRDRLSEVSRGWQSIMNWFPPDWAFGHVGLEKKIAFGWLRKFGLLFRAF